jgi:hypothetical protein
MPDGTTVVHHEEEHVEERHTVEALFAGSMAGGLIAAGAAVLSIIGLAGAFPGLLVGIATLGVGGAFLFEGAAIMMRLTDLLHEVTEGAVETAELGVGTTGETLAGLAGIALGILSIVAVVPEILVPIAAIVFGAAFVMGAGTNVRISELTMGYREDHPMIRKVTREAVRGTTGLQVLVGLASITLGIIALAGATPLILSLVAMLADASAFLLTDTAVAGRMIAVFRHRA